MENLCSSREKAVDKSCQRCGVVVWETKKRKCNSCGGKMKPLGKNKEKYSQESEGIL